MDLGIEVILKIFSQKGLQDIFQKVENSKKSISENGQRILALKDQYIQIVEDVISFLQGNKQTLARQICTENFLPQASRFAQLEEMDWAFGSMGIQDKAKHLSTLFLEDISDFIVECVDEDFGFSRYAERLGRSANSFDELHTKLSAEPTYIDNISLEILQKKLETIKPKLICFSVPFPGNLYSAFRCAKFIKESFLDSKIAMGGGFANTELRSVSDPRVFQYFDFISLDDGELPIELMVSNVLDPSPQNPNYTFFKRTFLLENGKVNYNNYSLRKDYVQSELGTPDYSDLLLENYISVIEIANPMHSLWSDGRWNKLTMAHGCYWGKCTFCDVSLDYIKNYEPIAASILVNRMEEMINQTGENGFHFVDEAAPPALMRELALEILRRKLIVTWWTNIRFEKSFSRDLCILLQASGCIAVSGGLEVASDRLLEVIKKGVTVEQVAKVTRNFTEAGIMVHSYLMYGYPTQTIQETVDSLEMVRQMFELGVLHSGFWHQFALTAHSPVGINPEEYGIKPEKQDISFANNDIQFVDSTGINHDKFSFGLKKSLFNFMHGMCFDYPLQEWFDFKIPKTQIKKDFIAECLKQDDGFVMRDSTKLVWMGAAPSYSNEISMKRGRKISLMHLKIHDKRDTIDLSLPEEIGHWLLETIEKMKNTATDAYTFGEAKIDFQKISPDFDQVWYSDEIQQLKIEGLILCL